MTEHLVIRVPLPADIRDRSRLIVNADTHLDALNTLVDGVTHSIEAPPVKRERKKKPAAPATPPGQTDIEDVTGKPTAETEPPAPTPAHTGKKTK